MTGRTDWFALFRLMERFGWTWQQVQDTPRHVILMALAYMSQCTDDEKEAEQLRQRQAQIDQERRRRYGHAR